MDVLMVPLMMIEAGQVGMMLGLLVLAVGLAVYAWTYIADATDDDDSP